MTNTTINTSSLEAIAKQICDHCCCDLGQTRTSGVPGEGNAHAEIMFVGEAPGQSEDEQGRPFVGQAGMFLEEMLTSVGLRRADVFIANILKCRPPGNRDPLPEEIAACQGFLRAQIALIQPKLIVCLGRHSMNYFLPGLKISHVHGQPKRLGNQVYLPLYHPAAALHNGSLRSTLEEDFQRIPAIMNKINQTTVEEHPQPSQQPTNQLPLL